MKQSTSMIGRLDGVAASLIAMVLSASAAVAAPVAVDLIDLAETEPIDVGAGAVPQSASPLGLAALDENREWKSRFDLGANGSFGNTDTQGVGLVVQSRREVEGERTSLDGSYFMGWSNGDRDTNNATIAARQDWLFPDSRWFWFASGRFQYDEFNSWEYRAAIHSGPGYMIIEEENLNVGLRAGLGFTKEWGSDGDPFRWEAAFGADVVWKISERQTLEFHTTIYPRLDDFADYYTFSTVDWVLQVDPEVGMNLTAGLRHQYQAKVDPGFDQNDWTFLIGLGFDF